MPRECAADLAGADDADLERRAGRLGLDPRCIKQRDGAEHETRGDGEQSAATDV